MLSSGEALPDYYFSITPWLVGGWNTAEDWWGGPLGDKTETIEAVRAIPPFVRRFSWDDAASPLPVEPEPNMPAPSEPPPVIPDPTQPVPLDPKPVEPMPALDWDPRLDTLGVRLTRMDGAGPAWRLVAARLLDRDEAGGKHHVYVHAQQADGTPVADARFLVDWIGRRADEAPGYAVTNAAGEGNYPIFIGMDPAQQNGIVFAAPADAPGDRVDGMGLPNNDQVAYVLRFIWQEKR